MSRIAAVPCDPFAEVVLVELEPVLAAAAEQIDEQAARDRRCELDEAFDAVWDERLARMLEDVFDEEIESTDVVGELIRHRLVGTGVLDEHARDVRPRHDLRFDVVGDALERVDDGRVPDVDERS